MYRNMGLGKLAEHEYKESVDEMKHAEKLVERILYLEGAPNLQRLGALRIGETVPEMFQADLELEYAAVDRLNRGIALATERADNGTRDLFERILVAEEEHIDWLETRLGLIKSVGLQNFLQSQMDVSDD
jgi:bacterioferritin